MPRARTGETKSGGRGRSLAQVYRRFGEGEGAKTSPLYGRIAVALSESAEALDVIESAPARKRQPAIVLAALHNLVLAGEALALARAFAVASDAATREAGLDRIGAAAVEAVVGNAGAVLGRVHARKVRPDEGGRHAVLYPSIGEVARRVGAGSVGLIDVGRSAGLNLTVDQVGIAYGNGQSLGDPASAVQVAASVVGDGQLPPVVIPEVVARVAVGEDLVDVTDAEEVRWLRACVPPDQIERLARLEAELELAAGRPPALVPGEVVDVLPEAIAKVPDGVLPVVMTTWALSNLDLEGRLRFLQRLDEAATKRPVAWVSVEGVGVAPGIPTYGDRRASGHSIIGVSVFDHSSFHATAVGRCWLRGELLTWLAEP
ncbi:DUF2332 domain-containing protein [Kribbella sp. NPDC004536]|uniref:DUF2332 domain-containing protein n=1 Tax=Kribbella sp. NPDC004536 TaxID=3364106 RepID=UPI00369D05BE